MREFIDGVPRPVPGLSRTASCEPGLRWAYVGVLAQEVFFVATYAFVARVVPIKVVVLGCNSLVFEIDPSFFGFLCGFGTVHPQQGGWLVRR